MTVVTNETLAAECRQERQEFYHKRNREAPSPACLALFRRAFSGDEDAWAKVVAGFQGQVKGWVKSWEKLLTLVEVEDLVQDAFLNFHRYAPQKPQLLATTTLGPVMKYLYLCAKSAALQLQRQHEGLTAFVELEDHLEKADPVDQVEVTALRTALGPFITRWVTSEDEQLIFMLYFESNWKPQEIFADYAQRFQSYEEVAKILQRLIRRMRKDANEVQQALYGAGASRGLAADRPGSTVLAYSILDDGTLAEKDSNVATPNRSTECPYSEELLLEYLLGRAAPVVVRAIQESTSCQAAANDLKQSLGALLPLLYRRQCPDPLTLLEYQERQLTGVQQLLIHHHVENCPRCQQELQLSTMLDHTARPFAEVATPLATVRRVVEAIFQSPLASPQPVRGDLGSYRTAQVVIRLNVRLNAGRARTWALRGQIRNAAGNLIAEAVEQILLQRLDDEQAAELTTTIPPGESSFVYKELPAGSYRLRVITADEEITIRQITIGIDE